MQITSIAFNEANQACPGCLGEQHFNANYTFPAWVYSENENTPLGYCENHGPWEIESYGDYTSAEKFHIENSQLLMRGVLTGTTMMTRGTDKDGIHQYFMAHCNHDGTVSIIAKMLNYHEYETLTRD